MRSLRFGAALVVATLVHVAGAWRGHERRRRDAALAERDRLLAETSASA